MDVPRPSDPLRELADALSADYDVETVLGVGGMGTVLRARDRKLDRPVAIKVVAPELVSHESTRRRFLEESRVLAKLRHPGIVTVHTAGEAAGLLYFVMDLIPGESLRDRLNREGKLDSESTRRILCEIASALSYAHDHDVVHRDIKPENILLDRESERVMLSDFGIARVITGDDERLTRAGVSVGSPQYMSPEQALGQSDIDGRSDVYALGLVGYEMLAGAPPFSGSQQVVMSKQVTERPPPLVSRARETPPSLAAVIERALEKDPAKRWQSAPEMARALEGGPVPASRARSRRGAVVASGALAGLLVMFVAWNALRGGSRGVTSAEARKSFFIAPFEVQGNDPSLAWLREASMTMLGLNLSSWSDVRVVPYERAIDLLREANLDERGRVGLDAARSLARRAGYATVVTGQVIPIRDSLTVVARVYDVARGTLLDTKTVAVAAGADPRTIFDSLASQLLDLAGAPPMTPELARMTTKSLDAYRAYVAGLHSLRRLRYRSADSAFGVAIAADSGFVLAHYKRALTRAWMGGPRDSSTYLLREFASARATELPEREQAIVLGYDAFQRGLTAQQQGRAGEVAPLLAEAERYLRRVLDRDSTDAEAWFLLGDTYIHTPDSALGRAAPYEAVVRRFLRQARLNTNALRAFDRAIRYDSSFHVSWQHRMEIYVQASSDDQPFVMLGDSILFVRDPQAALPIERLQQARMATRYATIRDARQWTVQDPDAEQAHRALIEAYVAAEHYDSAAGAIREAIRRPAVSRPYMQYWLASMQFGATDPQAVATLRQALARLTIDSLRGTAGGRLTQALGPARALTFYHGMLGELERLSEIFSAIAPARVFRGEPFTSYAAVGIDNAEVREAFARMIRDTDGRANDLRPLQIPGELVGMVPYEPQMLWVAYLGLRDTMYFAPLRRWGFPVEPELLALAALDRGDRARAQALAAALPAVKAPTMVPPLFHRIADIRRFARAELFARLGDERSALRELDSIDRKNFHLTLQSVDPRWGMLARSFLLRGILHEQLGEREKAITAYRAFLDVWKDADPRLQPQLQQARERLRRLSDAPG